MDKLFKPTLGITMGDPGGIGPEICVKALHTREIYDLANPLIIGDKQIMENAVEFCGSTLSVREILSPEECRYEFGTIDVLDLKNMPLENLQLKKITAKQGRASFEYIDKAISLALSNAVDANVTGPISKEAINAAGFKYAGHTEIYAEKTGSTDYAMMLVDGDFRVIHVSTHVSLLKACEAVKKERVLKVINLADEAVFRMTGRRAHLAVAGLNPHCGEAGMFGTEDVEEILPAIHKAQEGGISVDGPVPADTVFSKMRGGRYDAVVVMYHDQGHIPMKLLGFQYDEKTGVWANLAGVNLTLGLPIIRTSVDHGTAFEIAGDGKANPQSMVEAIKMAAMLAGKQ